MFAEVVTAQSEPLPPWAVPMLVMIAAMMVLMFVILVLFLKQYKRCPPNRIMVIYGKASPDGSPVCVHGGARLIVPLFQDYAFLALEPIRVEVSRQVTSSGKRIADPVPRVFSVAIGTEPELMQTAAIRLLGLSVEDIARHAEDTIVTQLDRLLDAVEAGQTQPGTEEFYQRLESVLQNELGQLGLVLINFRRE